MSAGHFDSPLKSRTTVRGVLNDSYQYFLLSQNLLGKAKCLEECVTFLLYFRKEAMALDLVFGVKSEPFFAHCWLENRNSILLDTDFSAHDFTQICRVNLGRQE